MFMSVDEIQMPKTRDLDSWRAYIEDGNRMFCEHEIAILTRYIRRITGIHKKLIFPDRFRRDRATTIDLWNQYIEARQTPAEAAERYCSFANYKGKDAAARLQAARQKLNEEIDANPAMAEHILRGRQSSQVVKNFDFSRGRLPRRQGRKDRPMRVPMGPKRYPVPTAAHNSALPMAVHDAPIAPQFSFNFAIQKPASFLLRQDPNIGKHMVKQGRESPLRQSVSLHQVDDSENEVCNIEVQVGWSIDGLKGQIAGFERKNLVHRTRDPLPNSRRPQRSRLDGL